MTYLDYNATTPINARVLSAMIPVFEKNYGNPASPHGTGREAAQLVDEARHSVSSVLGCSPQDVIFTSGATESNNMVLCGLTRVLVSSTSSFWRPVNTRVVSSAHAL